MLDRHSPTPLHVQLEEAIKDRIANEEWRPNSQIPSENELSGTYGLSRMTTRGVITRLAHQGLVYRVPGKGTFVAEPKVANRPHLPIGIQGQLDELGIESRIILVGASQQEASARLRKQLDLAEGQRVHRIERLRTMNGAPLSIHLSFVPVERCPDLDTKDLESGQLRRILEESYGLRPARVVESVETALASERDAQLLQVKTGFTLLQLQETNYTEVGNPFEFCHVLFRGDKMKITFEFHNPTPKAAGGPRAT
ncbi:GntR family transcriptional regulator [Pseudonocardia sp. C8]|uniref:GntR family transcriptional regulator n=1 Tax=Pseudonocardia sp. C8 TaxID=2762759 RepID=UPI0016435342|nr:GntR family transcriptional regulator [Pseudonocardia sp. C8]MBC3190329.1 GntR family transcriptional regulator [Pseudonocardia sp. C8]